MSDVDKNGDPIFCPHGVHRRVLEWASRQCPWSPPCDRFSNGKPCYAEAHPVEGVYCPRADALAALQLVTAPEDLIRDSEGRRDEAAPS